MKSEFRIEAVLFDMDGTLIDTEFAAANAIQKCFQGWKIQIEAVDAEYVTGRTWESAFTYLFQKYDLPVKEEEARGLMLSSYRKALEAELPVVPGSVEAVRSLVDKFPLALVSGSNRSEILWALGKLKIDHHFKVILGAEDYLRSKPQPDGYLKAVQALGARPESCLVFEDSTAGIASARAAGMWVAAITSTNHFKQDLSAAHFHISDLTKVTPAWIENLSFD